jgi:hypothetical protein
MSGLPPHLLLNLRLLRLKLTGQTTEYPVGELVDASSDRMYQVPVSEQGLHTWWLLAGRRGIRVWPAAALLGGLLLLLSIHAARLVREYRPPIEQQRRRS